jgi:DNA-directed RNA polymerase III subunit RPC8
MFIVTSMTDSIRISPYDLKAATTSAIEQILTDEIDVKYTNRVITGIGLVLGLFSIDKIAESMIYPGDGGAYTTVSFQLLVFSPFYGEIITGKVKSQDPIYGIRISLDFMDDIFVPPPLMREGWVFNPTKHVWVWNYTQDSGLTNELFVDNGAVIRFRVRSVLYNTNENMQSSLNEDSIVPSLSGSKPISSDVKIQKNVATSDKVGSSKAIEISSESDSDDSDISSSSSSLSSSSESSSNDSSSSKSSSQSDSSDEEEALSENELLLRKTASSRKRPTSDLLVAGGDEIMDVHDGANLHAYSSSLTRNPFSPSSQIPPTGSYYRSTFERGILSTQVHKRVSTSNRFSTAAGSISPTLLSSEEDSSTFKFDEGMARMLRLPGGPPAMSVIGMVTEDGCGLSAWW